LCPYRRATGQRGIENTRFWLPDEAIVYIGMASSLATRVGDYYATPDRGATIHAGGYFLKFWPICEIPRPLRSM
jgi:hypothetical protein